MADKKSTAAKTPAKARPSPMIEQFQHLKSAHPGTLLFFRMGDFYELFFDDAVQAAPALGIALTRRGQHEGKPIPMCGVPVHSAESYLEKLIRRGFEVAICEQMEDPAEARKRAGKTLVRRDVVRIVTPGTLTEDSLLDSRRHNFLGALARTGDHAALAWVDISTGAFFTEAVEPAAIGPLVARVAPGELLVADALLQDESLAPVLADWRDRVTPVENGRFESVRSERLLTRQFKVGALEVFGRFERAELAAAGALVDYLQLTQKGLLPRLDPPRRIEPSSILRIDPATRRNLELLQTLDGQRKGSLLAAIDRTRTGLGARLLAERLAAPLAVAPAINERLAEVEAFLEEPALRERVREGLKQVPDLPRALSRLSLGRGGPRDLLLIGRGIEAAARLRTELTASRPELRRLGEAICDLQSLAARLVANIEEQPPYLAREGGFIRSGAHPELDELRGLRDQGRRMIAELEARYRESSGIGSLKIRHNNMLGFYIEITAAHRKKAPQDFVQRQSMANATRYTTPELSELENRIATAAEKAIALELSLFDELAHAVLEAGAGISASAEAIAAIDVAASMAQLAHEQGYVRPTITEGFEFDVERGRHAVVEQSLAEANERFVPNDCCLADEQRLWLLTGPNMAGKSTFLRQNALIVVLAQCGSYVPAASATIGVVDKLFSRVGAADDIARGRSTFMVEMVETATILNQATERSLVILDEIGRGTATYDGLSLAWAVVEYLHEVNACRGLFATHYHELTALSSKLPALSAHHVRVKEWQGEVVFLHEVAQGSADRSYGIHVARLAGLPRAVLERAEKVLHRLEAGEARSAPAQLAEDLPLFRAALPAAAPAAPPSPVIEMLRQTNPDDLSPRAALDLVYTLKRTIVDEEDDSR